MAGARYRAGVLPLHALLDRRYSGDDALLRLARLRLEQAGLAAEADGSGEEHLEHLLAFAPDVGRPPTTHLPRSLDATDEMDLDRIVGFVDRFGPRLGGFVLHDRAHFVRRPDDVRAACERISRALTSSGGAWLYLEYSARLEPAEFARLAEIVSGIDRISVCLDIGHIGVAAARRRFAALHPAPEPGLTALAVDDPRLPGLADDVRAATAAGLPAVLEILEAVAGHSKPVHLHLHDGHPLGPGLVDHRPFLDLLPVPFVHDDRRSFDLMFGPDGVARIVRTARDLLGEACSFTLEIHNVERRVPLADAAGLFGHWSDLTNAELTNGWLSAMQENAKLVRGFR